MLRITGHGSKIWKAFEHQFSEGWKSAEQIYSKESGGLRRTL
jgi:hypothetical protein